MPHPHMIGIFWFRASYLLCVQTPLSVPQKQREKSTSWSHACFRYPFIDNGPLSMKPLAQHAWMQSLYYLKTFQKYLYYILSPCPNPDCACTCPLYFHPRTTPGRWFSFPHVSPINGTGVVRLGNRCLAPSKPSQGPSTSVTSKLLSTSSPRLAQKKPNRLIFDLKLALSWREWRSSKQKKGPVCSLFSWDRT